MDDLRFPRLERYRTGGSRDHPEYSIPLPQSVSGKTTLLCPSLECTPRRFQLGDPPEDQEIREEHTRLVRRPPGMPGVTCPYCGTDAPDDDFIDPVDIEAVEKFAMDALEEGIDKMLEGWTKKLDREWRRQKGFLQLRATYEPSRRSTPRLPWREDLLRSLVCEICHRGYGVYAIGLFCPDCGGRSVSTHFKREVELILAQLDIADSVRADHGPELAYRLTGNAHEDVVTAFETYLKSIYRFASGVRFDAQKQAQIQRDLKGNPFQNIDRACTAYERLGIALLDGVTPEDVGFLQTNFGKRHIVGHNLGLVDDRYAEVAGDSNLGETVTLLVEETARFARLCDQIIERVEDLIPEFLPAGQGGREP